MGILDRFSSLISRREQSRLDPKGPLGLLPGDQLSRYDTRYEVTGTRIHVRGERLVFQYRLQAEDGSAAILVAGGNAADGFALETVRTDLDVAWDADAIPGEEEDEEFRLADQGSCAVQHFGETGAGQARQVRYRIFEDEDSGQVLSLEDYGGRREVRVGDPVYEGEFRFHGGAGPDEERAWDTDSDACDEQSSAEDDDVARGSPMAAAMALEGRLAASADDASTYAAEDSTEFGDAEWSDAEDVEESNSFLQTNDSFSFSESAGWLEPTLFVAGSQYDAPESEEDDWLKRD